MAFGPQPYIPRGIGPRGGYSPWNVVDLSVPRAGFQMPQWGGPAMLNAGPQSAIPMGQVAGMGNWIPGQLPLTQSLPMGAGVPTSSLPFAPPSMRVSPSGIPMGAGAGDLSHLYSPVETAINPAASRAARAGWGPVEAAGVRPTTAYPTMNIQSTPAGVGQPNVANLYENVYAGNPAPPAMPDLPAPPSTINPAASTAVAESQAAKLGALKGIPGQVWGGMTGSVIPGLTGAKAMGSNILISAGLGYASRALTDAGIENSETGRVFNRGLQGASTGATLGRPAMLAGAASAATIQHGAELRKRVEEKGVGGLLPEMDSPDDIPGAALETVALPFTAPLSAVGAAMGGDNPLSKVPVIGGFFGGGDDEKKDDESAAAATPDYAKDPVVAENTLRDTMTQIGLTADLQAAVMDQYNTAVTLAMANPVALDPADPEGKKTITLTPEQIREGAYQKALTSLPGIKQQMVGERDSTRRAAALQAAIVNQIPNTTQPFYDAAHAGYDTLGQALSGMPSSMQGAGQSYIDNMRAQTGRLGDAWATGLASIPQYLAMESQASQADSVRNQIQSQIQQAQIMQALQAQMPDLFPSSSGGGSGLGISAEDLQALTGSK